MAKHANLTYADYLLIPDDGKRHEIIDGKHYVTPSPSTRHQRICLNIASTLREYARRSGAGEAFIAPLDVVLSNNNVLEPDVLFVSSARASVVTDKNIWGAPDLAVEVVSDCTRRRDVSIKLRVYAARGVREYWIVDPESKSVTVYRASGPGAYEKALELTGESAEGITSPILPGLSLSLADIFG